MLSCTAYAMVWPGKVFVFNWEMVANQHRFWKAYPNSINGIVKAPAWEPLKARTIPKALEGYSDTAADGAGGLYEIDRAVVLAYDRHIPLCKQVM
jgi:hypothetical protein